MLAEQVLNFLVGFYDTWLSGRISSTATSAIGLGAYVGWLVSMLVTLVGAGTTALTARFWGAEERERANDVLGRSITLAALLGVTLSAIFYASAPAFATLLNMQGEVRTIAISYMRIDAFGHLFMGLALVGSAALRGVGQMRVPLYIFGGVNVVNMAASTAFVFGFGPLPAFGVEGIAWGTFVARATGAAAILLVLVRGVSGLKLTPTTLLLRGDLVGRITRIGMPAALDGLVTWIGHFGFLMIIGRLDGGGFRSASFAAHVIGIRVEAITYLPAIAWGAAAATVVGQSLGKGDALRARKTGWTAVRQAAVLGMLLTLGFVLGAEQIYALMHTDPSVGDVGAPAFRMLGLFQIPLMISIILTAALRGAGDTRTSLFVTIAIMFLVRVPLAYLCGIVLEGGLIGAWVGMCSDMLLRSLLMSWRYIVGRWDEVEV